MILYQALLLGLALYLVNLSLKFEGGFWCLGLPSLMVALPFVLVTARRYAFSRRHPVMD